MKIQHLAVIILLITLSACGKKADSEPKTAEQRQAEKAANDKTVRDNPVYGDQFKAMDKAKDVQKTLEKQAEETAKKVDESAK